MAKRIPVTALIQNVNKYVINITIYKIQEKTCNKTDKKFGQDTYILSTWSMSAIFYMYTVKLKTLAAMF